MLRFLAPLVPVAAFLLLSSVADAQKSTERYIPIGQSPGLSGKYTVIGRVAEIDMKTRTMTITGQSRTWTTKLGDRTQIWLDCSAFQHPNGRGTLDDCKPGLLCEIKYEGRGPDTITCEWIKVQPASVDGTPRR